jgi:hypothetical protein
MEQKYYREIVRWHDLPRVVRGKPFEADFTMNMYDEPEGAEIPGHSYRVRVLPKIYWEIGRYADSRSYLVESTAGSPQRFILTSNSSHHCDYVTPEGIGEDEFQAAVDLAGNFELPDLT